jgi:hypothetical protein
MKLGVDVLGAAAIATGIVNLIFGAFDPAEEPIQAWVDNVPHGLFPDAVALLLIAGGVAILFARTTAFGAFVLGLCYLLFAAFCAPRVYTAPHYLGWPHVFGAAAGVGQNLIVAAAAALVYLSAVPAASSRRANLAEIARWVFGVSTIVFGLGHFSGMASVAAMVPKQMPLGGEFWAAVTGVAFVLAGIAILWGVLDVFAARLLALMLLAFSVLTLGPMLFSYPHAHAAWGVNVYNLAAAGAAWILADWLASSGAALGLQRREAPGVG